MNPNKFQVNDIVIAPTIFNGTGIITNTNSGGIFNITVEHNTEEYHFTSYGASNTEASTPSLYHVGTEITIKEKFPSGGIIMGESIIKRLALVLAISAELEGMKMCNIKNHLQDELFEYDHNSFFQKAHELRSLASRQLKPEE